MSRRLAVVAFTSLLVASCGGESQTGAEASPLEAIYGEPLSPAEQRAKQLEAEESIAQCMREEGWEYSPVDYEAQFNNEAFDDPTEPGYGEKYGYGIVRRYEIYEWPYLDDEGNYTDGGFGGDFEDPNMDYVNGLDPDAQTEYYTALYGDQTAFEEPTFDDSGEQVYVAPPLEEQGCSGKSQLAVFGEQPYNDQDFNDRFSTLMEDMQNDPRLEDAEIAWSDCVYEADPQYDFFGQQDTYSHIESLMQEAKGLKPMPADPDTGMVEGGDGSEMVWMTTMNADGTSTAWVGQPRKLTEAELRDIQADEVALWTIDEQCQDDTDYEDARREVEQEIADIMREEFPQFDGSQNGAQG